MASNDRMGTIQLNGKYYRIDLNSYHGRDVTDFSPRASTPGGGIVFSEMNAYQVIGQDDWRHGFGFPWFSDSAGYEDTIGKIDTRDAHAIKLSSAVTDFGVVDKYIRAFAKSHISNGGTAVWIAYGDGTGAGTCGMFKSTLTSGKITGWTAIAAFNDLKVNCVWSNGSYTFAAVDGATRLKKSNAADLVTWTDAGVNECCIGFSWIVAHDGFVFLGKAADGTLTGGAHPAAATHHWYSNEVFFDNTTDLSGLMGAEEDDTDEIIVGIKGRAVINAVSFNGELYFIRRDAIYKMDKDRSAARRVLDFSDQVDDKNFSLCVVFNGALYFNIRNRIYQWNGVRTADVTPPEVHSPTNPNYLYKFNYVYSGAVIGSYLFVTGAMVEHISGSVKEYDIFTYDGVGWTVYSNFASTPLAFGYDPDHQQLLIFLAEHIYSLQPDTGEFARTFPTDAGNAVVSSRFDAGFRLITKSTPSVLVQANGLSATHQEIYVYYKLDGATSWTYWGGSKANATVNVSGLTTLSNPLADASGQSSLEYKWIQFKFELYSDAAASTPVMEAFGLRLIMRPATGYGYSFNVVGAKNVQYGRGRTDDRKASEVVADLRTARNSTKWVTYVDPYGVSHLVYVTALNEIAVEEHVDGLGNTPDIEQMITVNVLEIL